MSFLFVAILLVAVLNVRGELERCSSSRRWYVGATEYSPLQFQGQVLIYTYCADGYKPTSDKIVRCIGGVTEEPLPQCQKVNGDLDRCWYSGRWYVGDTEYIAVRHQGEVYIYTNCKKQGYVAMNNENIRCIGGYSEKPLPRCEKVVGGCPVLPIPVYGSKSCTEELPAERTMCKFQCSRAYFIRGSQQRVCERNHQWTGATPWCVQRPECPVPPPLMNGSVMNCSKAKKVLFEDSCTFRCNSGFKLIGASVLFCRFHGRLTDRQGREGHPQCVVRFQKPCSDCEWVKQIIIDGNRPVIGNIATFSPARLTTFVHMDFPKDKRLLTGAAHPFSVCGMNIDTLHMNWYEDNPVFSASPFHPVSPYNPPGGSHPSSSPCSHANGGCDQVCNDEGGVVQCSCRRWWKLSRDGRTCEDIDECRIGVHHCQHNCTNTYGGYKCSCGPGYQLIDGHHCQAIPESSRPSVQYPYGQRPNQGNLQSTGQHTPSCTWNNGGCQHHCDTKEGGAECRCYDGYELGSNGKSCRRVRLSVLLRPDFHPESSQDQNSPGQLTTPVADRSCSRQKGGCAHTCNEEGATVTCSCNSGYTLKTDGRGCTDIDECVSETFGCSHSCVNTQGGAYCYCPRGLRLQEDQKTCEDVDECLDDNLNRCDHNCHNTEGNYTCSCNAGYISLKEFKCQACRYNSYRSGGDVACLECPPNSYTKAEAQTSIGDCYCSPGFSGDLAKNIPCEDINECSTGNFGCSHVCMNTPGDAFCSCSPGFELQEDQKTCQDIDECRIKNGGCQGVCHNTDGAFYCSCAKGYKLSDVDGYSCIDVDECQEQNGGCSDLCTNFPGSYHCSCPGGYHMDGGGKSCTAIRCPKFLIPHHSNVRCFHKSDVANKTFFRTGELSESMEFPSGTYCRVVCNKGYETDESTRTIKCQSDRKWNATLPDCEVLQCPPLSAPEHGDVHPPECLTESMPVKTRCYFTCQPDYRLQGEQMLVCKNNLTWKAKELPRCVPIKVVPFISCPEDVSVSLQSNESSATLTLPPPLTNMEHFQVEPEWVIVDEPTVFEAGQTDVIFSVISWKNKTIKCEMSVRVSDGVSPVFDYCPDSFDVEEGDVYGVRVDWDEPKASDNVGIQSILRNLEPNSTLTPGVHFVEYVAKDFAGNVAKCSFEINVTSDAECSDLADPENGEANCMDWMVGKICEPICNANYTLRQNEVYVCDDTATWHPSDVIPPCLPECPLGEIWSTLLEKCEEDTEYGFNTIPPQ